MLAEMRGGSRVAAASARVSAGVLDSSKGASKMWEPRENMGLSSTPCMHATAWGLSHPCGTWHVGSHAVEQLSLMADY